MGVGIFIFQKETRPPEEIFWEADPSSGWVFRAFPWLGHYCQFQATFLAPPAACLHIGTERQVTHQF